MPSKKLLYEFCLSFIENRISRIQNDIRNVQESLTSETKSSAGDKHETGRAMLQLEREKLGHQLAEAESVVQVLMKVPLDTKSKTVRLGNKVKTSKGSYYLAISAGACNVEGETVFCISPRTPVGQLLLSKSIGDTYNFNGDEISILEVS
ncbi:hypothetical protein LCGC14_0951360 [marine sediment metagenome]|uniref:3-oxoacyl-ACP synthase n=2 Tax=root TaxID=1 RepID=A0A831VPF8_9FLAO|nr:3-oxoacyl-ACP synthase [Pricia antarctica]